MNASATDIRNQTASFLAGRISLDDFEDWISGNTWDLRNGDPVAQSLASEIELRLAEYSSSHLPMDQMLEEFRSLLSGFLIMNIRLNADPVPSRTGGSIVVESARAMVQCGERLPLTVYA